MTFARKPLSYLRATSSMSHSTGCVCGTLPVLWRVLIGQPQSALMNRAIYASLPPIASYAVARTYGAWCMSHGAWPGFTAYRA